MSLDALMGVSWEGRSRELLTLHTRFESMAEAVCADASVNLDWCEPFTFSLGRFYYLLEHKLDVFVDDPASSGPSPIRSGSPSIGSRDWKPCSVDCLARGNGF